MELTMENYIDYINSKEYSELLEQIDNSIKAYEKKSESFFNSMSYDDQLKAFYHVVKMIYDGTLVENGSYRHILYNKFNFGPDSYTLGMDCGLLELNNSIYSYKEVATTLKDIFNYLNLELDNATFYRMCDRFALGSFGITGITKRSVQLSLDFNDN